MAIGGRGRRARYLLVFQSRRWSLLERVRQSPRIVVFLRVLRRHVQLADGLNLEANFLCNQTYTHVLLSLHTVSGFVARRGVVLLPAPPRVVVGGEAVWRRLGRVLLLLLLFLLLLFLLLLGAYGGMPQAVLHVLAHATLGKSGNVHLDRLGSDVLEDFFRCVHARALVCLCSCVCMSPSFSSPRRLCLVYPSFSISLGL